MVIGFCLFAAAILFCLLGNKTPEAGQLYYDLQDLDTADKKPKKTKVSVDTQAGRSVKKKQSSQEIPEDDADTLAQAIYDETDM